MFTGYDLDLTHARLVGLPFPQRPPGMAPNLSVDLEMGSILFRAKLIPGLPLGAVRRTVQGKKKKLT